MAGADASWGCGGAGGGKSSGRTIGCGMAGGAASWGCGGADGGTGCGRTFGCGGAGRNLSCGFGGGGGGGRAGGGASCGCEGSCVGASGASSSTVGCGGGGGDLSCGCGRGGGSGRGGCGAGCGRTGGGASSGVAAAPLVSRRLGLLSCWQRVTAALPGTVPPGVRGRGWAPAVGNETECDSGWPLLDTNIECVRHHRAPVLAATPPPSQPISQFLSSICASLTASGASVCEPSLFIYDIKMATSIV